MIAQFSLDNLMLFKVKSNSLIYTTSNLTIYWIVLIPNNIEI